MKSIEEIYEEFGRLLEEKKVHKDKSCDFVSVCRMLDTDPEEFGKYVFSQVGMSGDEVLDLYRRTDAGAQDVG